MFNELFPGAIFRKDYSYEHFKYNNDVWVCFYVISRDRNDNLIS